MVFATKVRQLKIKEKMKKKEDLFHNMYRLQILLISKLIEANKHFILYQFLMKKGEKALD